jgi:hypothetical protein
MLRRSLLFSATVFLITLSAVASALPPAPQPPDAVKAQALDMFANGVSWRCRRCSGLFTDIDDNRPHGRDERIPIDGLYQDVEFTYRLMKTLSSAD